MQVAWVSDTFEQLNGVAVYIKKTVPLLRDRGADVTVYTGRVNGKYDFPIRHVPSFPFPVFPNYDVIVPNFTKLDADVMHVHTAYSLGQYCSFLGGRKVVTTHLHPYHLLEAAFGYNQPKMLQDLAWWYVVSFFNRFDVVVCQTAATRDIFQKRGMKAKAVVIPNGMDMSKSIEVMGPPKEEFAKRYGVKGEYALYLGRLDASKGINWVIETAKALPNRQFVIIGEGSREEEVKGIPNVFHLGRIMGEEKRAAFCEASMLIMPSVIETEGIVVQEAMLCKTPVLISGNEVLREVVGKGGISCMSAAELTSNTEELFRNPSLRKELGEKGFEEVKKRDVLKAIDLLKGVYESLL